VDSASSAARSLMATALAQEASKSLSSEELALLRALDDKAVVEKLVSGSEGDAEAEFKKALKDSHVL